MNGKLKDWSFSRTGESVLTITTRESCKKLWDALGDQEITFSIKRRVIPRSLNANNYAWSLIEKLAVAVKSDKDSVYEEMLRRYGKIYLCRNCMAYVGVHKGTDKPLGRLANAELRNWKKAAHAVFDPLWKYGRFRGHRNAAYAWLAQKMGLPVEKTHIGMFDVGQCRKAIEIIEKETKGDRYGRYQKDPS